MWWVWLVLYLEAIWKLSYFNEFVMYLEINWPSSLSLCAWNDRQMQTNTIKLVLSHANLCMRLKIMIMISSVDLIFSKLWNCIVERWNCVKSQRPGVCDLTSMTHKSEEKVHESKKRATFTHHTHSHSYTVSCQGPDVYCEVKHNKKN